jgi:ApaG protein
VWAYQVTIDNQGNEKVQLKNRYWKIIDSNGSEQEVKGEGVVGEQPVLNPGEKFEYTSGTPLSTPSGFMGGHYEMETKTGKKFEAIIPQFSLDSPFIKNNLN